ncbi:hypothetical protein PR048_023159 [Dryococelus australis]|uniref:Uncharacterized protein n=1 Tax=Dryococelus australis TaxID=614101 RepID=A0ABQ9GTD7_9NEOP|nr:hypothetical protein PR048_023159 [Dryococelus australis]
MMTCPHVKCRRLRIYVSLQLGQPCDANENDSEHDEDDATKPVTCSEAMQHLEAYSHYKQCTRCPRKYNKEPLGTRILYSQFI